MRKTDLRRYCVSITPQNPVLSAFVSSPQWNISSALSFILASFCKPFSPYFSFFYQLFFLSFSRHTFRTEYLSGFQCLCLSISFSFLFNCKGVTTITSSYKILELENLSFCHACIWAIPYENDDDDCDEVLDVDMLWSKFEVLDCKSSFF